MQRNRCDRSTLRNRLVSDRFVSTVVIFLCSLAYLHPAASSAAPSTHVQSPEMKRGWKFYYDCDMWNLQILFNGLPKQVKEQADWYELMAMGSLSLSSDEALTYIEHAAKLAPNNSHLLATQAWVLARASKPKGERVQKAIAIVTNCIRLEPKDGRNHAILGACLERNGKIAQATKECNQAITLSPGDFDVNNICGEFFSQILEDGTATECYDRLVKNYPNSPRSYQVRSQFRKKYDNTKGAIEDLTKGIELLPKRPMLYFSRGSLLLQMHEYARALNDFNAVAKVDPGWDLDIRQPRAACYEGLKQYEKAVNDYSEAIKGFTKEGSVYEPRGTSAPNAEADYLRLWLMRAGCREQAGHVEEALKDMDIVLRYRQKNQKALMQHVHYLVLLHRNADALNDFNKLIKTFPAISSLRRDRAKVLTLLGRTQEASFDTRESARLEKLGL